MNLDDFKKQLVDFQSSIIWKQKFVLQWSELGEIKHNTAVDSLVENTTKLKNYSTLKKV